MKTIRVRYLNSTANLPNRLVVEDVDYTGKPVSLHSEYFFGCKTLEDMATKMAYDFMANWRLTDNYKLACGEFRGTWYFVPYLEYKGKR